MGVLSLYSVGLYTLGCKVSQYETEAVREGFEKAGFVTRSFADVCDAYVINTCTVTAESDRKSRQFIRRAIKKNPDAVIAVVGCYAQRAPTDVAAIAGVDIVVGTNGKMSVIRQVIDRLENGRTGTSVSVGDVKCADFEQMRIERAPRTRAYLKIEDGCESKCTYCAIKEARGRVRSKPKEECIAEAESLAASGIYEIVLTGIETGLYGRDFGDGYSLADLICDLDRRGRVNRIRLGSLAPELVSEKFADKVRGAKILAPHFHISMQSGSDRVLAAMKRKYNCTQAFENIMRLKRIFPTANFTTDIMVGFPGEREEDFLATVDFVKKVRFLDVHVFAYSRREDTPAAEYPDQVSEEEKRRRSERLIKIKNELRDELLSEYAERGDVLSAVAETLGKDGFYTGHTDSYVEVRFPVGGNKRMQGKEVRLKPVSHKNGILNCELVYNANKYLQYGE